jgi:hypothetical protein
LRGRCTGVQRGGSFLWHPHTQNALEVRPHWR